MEQLKLRQQINDKGLSVQKLAEEMNIHPATLYRKLNGDNEFTENEILILSRRLRLDPYYIMKRDKKKKQDLPDETVIIDGYGIKVTLTCGDDFIAVVENQLKNAPVIIKFDGGGEMEIKPNDWKGIRPTVEGIEQLYKFKHKLYRVL